MHVRLGLNNPECESLQADTDACDFPYSHDLTENNWIAKKETTVTQKEKVGEEKLDGQSKGEAKKV